MNAKWTPEAAGYQPAPAAPMLVKHRHGPSGLAVVTCVAGDWGWVVYGDDGSVIAGGRSWGMTPTDACAAANAVLSSLDPQPAAPSTTEATAR